MGLARSLTITLVLLLISVTAYGKVVRVYQGKLNVNTASAADLTRLPGIGEVIGFRIVKERERRGAFKDIRELREIKGVSQRVYEGFREHVAVRGENSLKVYTDLNTITKPLLLGIPGMSEGEARSILNYRKAHGGFEEVEDLLKVPGIGKKRLAELSEWLTVADERR